MVYSEQFSEFIPNFFVILLRTIQRIYSELFGYFILNFLRDLLRCFRLPQKHGPPVGRIALSASRAGDQACENFHGPAGPFQPADAAWMPEPDSAPSACLGRAVHSSRK